MDKMWNKSSLGYYFLREMSEFRNMGENYVQRIFECSLLLNDHDETLKQYRDIPRNNVNTTNLLSMISKNIVLGAPVLQYMAGEITPLVSLGILMPFALHYLISKLKKTQMSKHTENFEKLIMTMRKLYKLFKNVNNYHQDQITSVMNLSPHISRKLGKIMFPKMNMFLRKYGQDIVALTTSLNHLIDKITDAFRLNNIKAVYEVAVERIDISLPVLQSHEDYIASFELYYLSYLLVISSFLCAIGLGFSSCDYSVFNYKEFFDEVLPEALELVCTSLTKISEEFRNVYGPLPGESSAEEEEEEGASQVSQRSTPVDRSLIDFIRKIRLVFDVAQIMHNDLQQTEHTNAQFILEEHFVNMQKLYSDCQDNLNDLKRVICRQVRIEDAKAARHAEQLVQSEVIAIVEEINGSASTSIIRHDDPDTPVNHEEYSLSMHGSDDEDEKEQRKTSSSLEYTDLVECIRRQKLIIMDLNNELKNKKLITQEEGASGQTQIPMARVTPMKKPTKRLRNLEPVAPTHNFAFEINLPPHEFAPPLPNLAMQLFEANDGALPAFEAAFQQALPQPNILEAGNIQPMMLQAVQPPPPPPLPDLRFNNLNLELDNYDIFENLAVQIQNAVLNNNVAGNEEVFQNELE